MTTIYILTEGSYSGYRIVAAYSTKELAEEAQKHCPDSVIEEYELDSLKIPEHPLGHTAWMVTINTKTNEIQYAGQFNTLGGNFNVREEYVEFPKSFSPRIYDPVYRVDCWAKGKDHAEKIALDKFYQWKWEKENGVEQ